jgi:hypothetical protein
MEDDPRAARVIGGPGPARDVAAVLDHCPHVA